MGLAAAAMKYQGRGDLNDRLGPSRMKAPTPGMKLNCVYGSHDSRWHCSPGVQCELRQIEGEGRWPVKENDREAATGHLPAWDYQAGCECQLHHLLGIRLISKFF